MYGLKPDTDFHFLIGKRLLQLCYGENELVLNFDDNTSILITSAVGVQLPESEPLRWENLRQSAGFLVAFANQTVDRAVGEVNGTLTIYFREGGALQIYDNSPDFESYVIKSGDQTIVV